MIELIYDGIKILQFIVKAREQLRENQRSCRRLCERVDIFNTFFKDLQNEEILKKKIQHFAGFDRALNNLVNLLREVEDYVKRHLGEPTTAKNEGDSGNTTTQEKAHTFMKNAKRLVVNVALRESKAQELTSLNQRINDCANNLLPGLMVNIERQRQEDYEDLRCYLEDLSNNIVQELNESQQQGNEQVMKLIQELQQECQRNQVTNDNQSQERQLGVHEEYLKQIQQGLATLATKFDGQSQLSSKDFQEFRVIMEDATKTILSTMKQELDQFKQNMVETKSMIQELKSGVDNMHIEILNSFETKLLSHQSISSKELNELKSTISNDQQQLMNKLEEKFVALDMLSVQRDLQEVKDILNELKSVSTSSVSTNKQQQEQQVEANNVVVQTMIQALEDKIVHRLGQVQSTSQSQSNDHANQLKELNKRIQVLPNQLHSIVSNLENDFKITAKELNTLKDCFKNSQNEQASKLMSFVETKLEALDLLSLKEDMKVVKSMLDDLKTTSQCRDDAMKAQLQQLEKQIMEQQSISAKELQELKHLLHDGMTRNEAMDEKMKEQYERQQQAIMSKLEAKLEEMDILSVRRDMQNLQSTVNTLKTHMDSQHSDLLQQMEAKLLQHVQSLTSVATSTATATSASTADAIAAASATTSTTIVDQLNNNMKITREELQQLKESIHMDNEEQKALFINALESQLQSLQLLVSDSNEQCEKKAEERHQVLKQNLQQVLVKEDDILENTMLTLQGIDNLAKGQQEILVLAKILAESKLTKDDVQSRQEMLQSLSIPSTSVTFPPKPIQLGQGGFGEVTLGLYNHSTKVAIKSILASTPTGSTRANGSAATTASKSDIEAIENEMLLMQYIGNHPHIITCYGYYQDANSLNKNIHVVLEYAPYNSLSTIIYDHDTFPHLSIRLLINWLKDLSSAIERVHSRKVRHRDIKAENCLVFQDLKIKLCDFGLAKQSSSSCSSAISVVGTDGFKAPEVITHGALYASDVYSWAMTAYQLLMRKAPNVNLSPLIRLENMFTCLKTDREICDKTFGIEQCKRLFQQCVDIDFTKRPSMMTVSQTMNSLVQEFEGDPRLKWSERDSVYINTIEAAAKAKYDKSSTITSTSASTGKDSAVSTATTMVGEKNCSGASTSTATSSNTTSTATSSNTTSTATVSTNSTVSSEALTTKFVNELHSEQAIQLLIYLGCSSKFHERAAELKSSELDITIDGSYLLGIKDAAMLQELEGSTSKLRAPVVEKAFTNLQGMIESGISKEILECIDTQLKARDGSKSNRSESVAIQSSNVAVTATSQQQPLSPTQAQESGTTGTETVEAPSPSTSEHVESNNEVSQQPTPPSPPSQVNIVPSPPTPPSPSPSPLALSQPPRVIFKASDVTLREAVNLWCSDRISAQERYGHIATWDTSEVKTMKDLFKGKKSFNDNINNWDVTNVENMNGMFWQAVSFNQPLNNWDVSKVTSMNKTFSIASAFNQPLNTWNVEKVINMSCMFSNASSFNQPLDYWNISKVTDMSFMFQGAKCFNQSLSTWQPRPNVNSQGIFQGAVAFTFTFPVS